MNRRTTRSLPAGPAGPAAQGWSPRAAAGPGGGTSGPFRDRGDRGADGAGGALAAPVAWRSRRLPQHVASGPACAPARSSASLRAPTSGSSESRAAARECSRRLRPDRRPGFWLCASQNRASSLFGSFRIRGRGAQHRNRRRPLVLGNQILGARHPGRLLGQGRRTERLAPGDQHDVHDSQNTPVLHRVSTDAIRSHVAENVSS